MAGGADILMDTLDNSFRRDDMATIYNTSCRRCEVGGQVAGMRTAPVEMTVETTDGHASLNNTLDTWIRCLQCAWVSGVGPGGVMAQGAIALMKSQNAIRASPGGGELRCV